MEVMLVCVRWYAAYPLSLRHLEEMMAERGVSVDNSTGSLRQSLMKFIWPNDRAIEPALHLAMSNHDHGARSK